MSATRQSGSGVRYAPCCRSYDSSASLSAVFANLHPGILADLRQMTIERAAVPGIRFRAIPQQVQSDWQRIRAPPVESHRGARARTRGGRVLRRSAMPQRFPSLRHFRTAPAHWGCVRPDLRVRTTTGTRDSSCPRVTSTNFREWENWRMDLGRRSTIRCRGQRGTGITGAS